MIPPSSSIKGNTEFCLHMAYKLTLAVYTTLQD
jgi:hypothetical protein